MSEIEISDEDLAHLDGTLERRHQDGSLYNENYGSTEVRALRARLRRVEAENQCDVCLGSGKPLNDRPCMCGGTGRLSDAARWFRERLVKVESDALHWADAYAKLREDESFEVAAPGKIKALRAALEVALAKNAEMKHSPVRGHSTDPRSEPKSVDQWQTWSETLQTDMEGQAERIVELEKALTQAKSSALTWEQRSDSEGTTLVVRDGEGAVQAQMFLKAPP